MKPDPRQRGTSHPKVNCCHNKFLSQFYCWRGQHRGWPSHLWLHLLRRCQERLLFAVQPVGVFFLHNGGRRDNISLLERVVVLHCFCYNYNGGLECQCSFCHVWMYGYAVDKQPLFSCLDLLQLLWFTCAKKITAW